MRVRLLLVCAVYLTLMAIAYAQSVGGMSGIAILNSGSSGGGGGGGSACKGVLDFSVGCTLGVLP